MSSALFFQSLFFSGGKPGPVAAFFASPSFSPCRCKSKNNRAAVTWDFHFSQSLGVPGDLHMDSTHLKYGAWCRGSGMETAVLSALQGRGLAQEQPAAHIAYIGISILLLVFQHCRSAIGDGVGAAQKFGDRFNLSLKSVTTRLSSQPTTFSLAIRLGTGLILETKSSASLRRTLASTYFF
jgi:hypothetical protein